MSALPPAPTNPTLRLLRPRPDEVARLASASAEVPVSYEGVGGTRGDAPPGFRADRHDGVVGSGEADFRAACDAIRGWTMFDLPWVELHDPTTPIEPGRVVAFSSHQLGVWMVNLCRLVYVVDEPDGPIARFGFAYGTLPGHAVAGEELFLATWDRATDEVRFAVSKFSRARHPLVRLTGPIGRSIQDTFSRHAIARVARAVAEAR
jgi:uncharacterized protein (UPF0548 family)